MLFIWPWLCQQEGDAQGGLVLSAGLQLEPRGWEVAGYIPRRGESEQSRDQQLHPSGNGAALGGKWDVSSPSPVGMWQQAL